MRLVVTGASGYRGSITDDVYNETDWGNGSDHNVKFMDVNGREIWLNYGFIISLNFKTGDLPSPGTHDLYRVQASAPRGDACDCLITEDEKALLDAQMASGMGDKILVFHTVYGIEIRLITANIAKILIVPEVLNVQEP